MPGIYETLHLITNHQNADSHIYEYEYIVSIFEELIHNKEYEALKKKFSQLPDDPMPLLKEHLETFETKLKKLVSDMNLVIQSPYQFERSIFTQIGI